MKLVTGAIIVGASLCASALAQDTSEMRAKREREQQAEHQFRNQRFAEAGFVPIDQTGKRELRRLIVRDPYGFLPIPGIEIERRADGTVILTLQYWAWRSEPSTIAGQSWDRLIELDDAAFGPKPIKPPPAYARNADPPPVCHGWMAHIQSSSGRTAGWWECQDGPGPQLSYLRAMVDAAMATRPDCKSEGEDPMWAFQKCFGVSEQLDDPQLEAIYSVLRKEYHDAPGADRLAEARIALRQPSLTIGSPQWRDARAAIAKVRAINNQRRELLRRLGELYYKSKDASKADKAKMKLAIDSWTQFIAAQESNYSDLLNRLVWAGE